MREAVGAEEAPRRFIAITDPGSKLEQLAEEQGFRHVAHGLASIGGRYSALSDFGMLPGAVMGLDVQALLDRAERMAHSCSHSVPAADNPGLVLGSIIGVCARRGRDKLTLVASPAIADLGAWLEQLLAESTGKDGRGVIPIDREPLGSPDVYGDDRLFVYVRLESSPDDSAGRSGRRARGGRPPGCPDRARRPLRHRWRALPVGVRDSGRGLRDRDQPVRPAGRRGVQGGDARAHGRTTSSTGSWPTRSRSQRSTESPCTRTSAMRPSCRPQPARTHSREC